MRFAVVAACKVRNRENRSKTQESPNERDPKAILPIIVVFSVVRGRASKRDQGAETGKKQRKENAKQKLIRSLKDKN